jgi:hypothetical protein
MSNALFNWHLTAGEPWGSDCTLEELADHAGRLLINLGVYPEEEERNEKTPPSDTQSES